MIKELILYFFLIFGFFSLVEVILKAFTGKDHLKNSYLVTFYNGKADREKIIYLAKSYEFKIFVISPAFTDTKEAEFITDRYFNVEFIKNAEEILMEE